MTHEFDHDPLLSRLSDEDPASGLADEGIGERDRVRRRAVRARDGRRGWLTSSASGRRRLAAGFGGAAAVVVGALILLGGGVGNAPAPALAIERGPEWITLTIKDPEASDEQMNAELEAAGIERVRVLSMPGPARDVGTWAGYVDFGPEGRGPDIYGPGTAACAGGVKKVGDYGIEIPVVKKYTTGPADSRDLIDLTIPQDTGAFLADELGSPYSGPSLRLALEQATDPTYSAKVLVPLRPESPNDGESPNELGVEQLAGLGGVFSQYADALEDGKTTCDEFGLSPWPPCRADYVDRRFAAFKRAARAGDLRIYEPIDRLDDFEAWALLGGPDCIVSDADVARLNRRLHEIRELVGEPVRLPRVMSREDLKDQVGGLREFKKAHGPGVLKDLLSTPRPVKGER